MEDYLTVEEAHRLIAQYILENPTHTYGMVASRFGYSTPMIGVIARKLGLPSRAAGKRRSRVQAKAVKELMVMKHGLVEVLDQIADDDRDFQWESPKLRTDSGGLRLNPSSTLTNQ